MASQHELYANWKLAVDKMKEAQTAYNERWKQIASLRETAQKQLKVVCSAELDIHIIGDDEVRRPILHEAKIKWKESAQKVRDALHPEATALANAHQSTRRAYDAMHK